MEKKKFFLGGVGRKEKKLKTKFKNKKIKI